MLKPQLPATSMADVTVIHARVRPGGEICHCSCLHTLRGVPFCFEVSGTQYAIYLFAPFHLEKEGPLRSFTTLLREYICAAFVDFNEVTLTGGETIPFKDTSYHGFSPDAFRRQ